MSVLFVVALDVFFHFFFPLHCAQRLYVKLGNYFKETSNIWYNQ